jgi:hypothetical protein
MESPGGALSLPKVAREKRALVRSRARLRAPCAHNGIHLDMVMGSILVPIEQHDLATRHQTVLLARKFDSYIEDAPARSCIALSLSVRSQPVSGTRIARQSDQEGFRCPHTNFISVRP